MNFKCSFFFLISILLILLVNKSKSKEFGISQELTKDNYQNILSPESKKPNIILITEQNCTICSKLEKYFARSASQLPFIQFLKIDYSKEPKLTLELQPSYSKPPSLVLYRDGRSREFTLSSVPQQIIEDMKALTNDDLLQIITRENKIQFSRIKDVKFLVYLDNIDRYLDDLKILARYFQFNVIIGVTDSKRIAHSFSLKNTGQSVLLKPQENKIFYNEIFDIDKIINFININKELLYIPLSNEKFKNIILNQKKKELFIFTKSEKKNANSKLISKIGIWLKKRNVQNSKIDKLYWIDMLKDYEVFNSMKIGNEPKEYPLLAIYHPNQFDYYRLSGKALTLKKIKRWIQQWENDEIQQHFKSSQPPENNNLPVTTLTASTFQSTVLDSNENWFVVYVTDWCTKCKLMEPLIEELAVWAKAQNISKIGSFDISGNDFDKGYPVKSFPAFLWFDKNKQKPELYNEKKNLKKFKKFLLKKSQSDVKEL
ncbi:protein disulfide isomerase [Anaeramoeba flamelloides]|uniref:Protein disulfide isomerase n=1 Tax=Anaeramoeba flamelloides TaxID=1746091 RepID=A0AAV7YS44_9EUKA|nr:protein disulfide isomerase [Anaeramoeba flamelloides]